jgi:hypothetical protein
LPPASVHCLQIWGMYDAKENVAGKSGFFPGGASLHR